jgi:hypothetical protein
VTVPDRELTPIIAKLPVGEAAGLAEAESRDLLVNRWLTGTTGTLARAARHAGQDSEPETATVPGAWASE